MFTDKLMNLSLEIESLKEEVDNEEVLYPLFSAMIALSLKLKTANLA